MSYLPKIDPAIDTNNCGLVKYAIPLQTSDNSFVTRVDWTINAEEQLLRAVLHRWLSGAGFLLADQHPDHDSVWQLAAGAVLYHGRGVHD